MAMIPRPYRIRPYRTIGGFLLIYQDWKSNWYPTIDAAMDHVYGLARR